VVGVGAVDGLAIVERSFRDCMAELAPSDLPSLPAAQLPCYVHHRTGLLRERPLMSLTLTIDLPAELERALRSSDCDLGRAAKEALAVALFRQGKLSHLELGGALGLDRFETDALLKRHQVTTGALTLADLELDRTALDQVLGPVRR
jgi:hypothetical protein